MYEVIFTESAAKLINTLQKGYKEKLRAIAEHLTNNPFCYPYKKIRGETDLYRIRLGKYRVLYEVNNAERRVTILKIDERGSVYK